MITALHSFRYPRPNGIYIHRYDEPGICEDCGKAIVVRGHVACDSCWYGKHPEPLGRDGLRIVGDGTMPPDRANFNGAHVKVGDRFLVKSPVAAFPQRKCLACGAVLVPKPYEIRAGDEQFARRLTCGMACRGKLQSARAKEKGGKLR